MSAQLEVLATGVGLSVQDGGRVGWRGYGVPVGGTMDRFAAARANELLGNSADAPVLEIVLQGARLRVLEDVWLALAGAQLGAELEPWSARLFRVGEVLDFRGGAQGLWAYLAVPGGFVVERFLGSASVDLRNGLGEPLIRGSRLAAAESVPRILESGVVCRRWVPECCRVYASELELALLPGPQFDLFSEAARERMVSADWTVGTSMDRTGYRLEGPALEVPASIPSEPVIPGSFQVPSNGQPIITMPDGPTVGGYAKIAVLKDADLDWVAQCRPGTKLQFQWADYC